MSLRKDFDEHLQQLKQDVLEMSRRSQTAVQQAMEALKSQNEELANEVIAGDEAIDELEHFINDRAIILIAKQAPVASDLRKIMVAIKVSSDVERIGDQAVNIAKSTLHIGQEKHIKPIVDIPNMMNMALAMVDDGVRSFQNEDVKLARLVAKRDDAVDEMYGKLVQELIGYIPKHPEHMNQITQLAFVCRYIERVADHVTNISENVIYLVTGNRYDLND